MQVNALFNCRVILMVSFSVAKVALLDSSNAAIKDIDIHIGNKAGITVDGTLTELDEEMNLYE